MLKALKKGEPTRAARGASREERAFLGGRHLVSRSLSRAPTPQQQQQPQLTKEFCCNGTVVEDPELGQVIQLQGDQRKNVTDFLVAEKLVKKELVKIHGF